MSPEQQCQLAAQTVQAVRIQLGKKGDAVTFESRMQKGAPWFYCPEHLVLGQFSTRIPSLLAEVLEAEGLLA